VTTDAFEWTREPGVGPGVGVLGDLAGRTVVELGCGSGRNLASLIDRHGARTGIGIDHDATKNYRASGWGGAVPALTFRRGVAAEPLHCLPPGSVDVCLSIFGALSFSDPGTILAATARALRPDGRFGLTLRADDLHDTVIILSRRSHENRDTNTLPL
jgi:SAM-dependent methyltransferase